jgi:hypothetical protein
MKNRDHQTPKHFPLVGGSYRVNSNGGISPDKPVKEPEATEAAEETSDEAPRARRHKG